MTSSKEILLRGAGSFFPCQQRPDKKVLKIWRAQVVVVHRGPWHTRTRTCLAPPWDTWDRAAIGENASQNSICRLAVFVYLIGTKRVFPRQMLAGKTRVSLGSRRVPGQILCYNTHRSVGSRPPLVQAMDLPPLLPPTRIDLVYCWCEKRQVSQHSPQMRAA